MGLPWESVNRSGATLSAGMVVAGHTDGFGVVKANATAPGVPAVAFFVRSMSGASTVSNGRKGKFRNSGMLDLADWTAATGAATLTPQATYYLDTTAGKMTTVSPVAPDLILPVGQAMSLTRFAIGGLGGTGGGAGGSGLTQAQVLARISIRV